MDTLELRFQCLRLAHEASAHLSTAPQMTRTVVARARAYAAFVRGTGDGAIVEAANALAEKVRDARA